MKKTAPLLLAFLACFLLANSALALDMEYYTYGGFNPIVQAFNRLALIFSDAGYVSLLTVMTLIGFVGGAFAWIAKAATGAKIIPLVWVIPVIAGAALYLALFVPKGNVTIYDPVLNRFQTVGDVPDGVILVAGTLNKIERGIVDIVDTAAVPDAHYSQTAGGIGLKALDAVKDSSPKNTYARNSMIRYTKDCVSFELVRPGTTLSLDDLRNTSTDFLIDLAKAVNPAVYTVYFDAANPAGQSMTCTAAWANLQPIYANPANYDEATKKMCSKAYFDSSNATEMTTCKALLTSTLNFTTGTGTSPEKIIQQRQIAEILYNFYYKDDYETSIRMESDRKITSSGMGLGITMNEWIPVIRAVLTAVAIGIIPFLVLFIPTPIMGKAISLLVGFFVFLTTWGVTDAVIHGAAMDYAANNFEDMRQSGLGVYAMAAFPTDATKMLAMFGVIRSAGIMLASLFSMMLIKFGGSALAHLATNLSGLVQNAGSQAGALLTPEGKSEAMQKQIQAAGLLDGMAEHRFSNMAAATAWGLSEKVGKHESAADLMGNMKRSGQISSTTTEPEFAKMMQGAHQGVGTADGPVDASLDPAGNITKMEAKSVTSQGFAKSLTTGKDGLGSAELKHSAGSLGYDIGIDGKQTLNNAQVNGVDPMKLGEMMVNQKTHAAAHNLTHSSAWEQMKGESSRIGSSDTTNRAFQDQMSNTKSSNLKREIAEGSGWAKDASNQEVAQVSAAVSAGGNISKFGASGSEGVSVRYADGTTRKLNLSENTADSLNKSLIRSETESVANTMSTSQGRDYLSGLSKRVGDSDTSSSMDEIRNISRNQASYGVNAMAPFVDNHARVKFGGNNPEQHQMAVKDINDLATNRGASGVNALREEMSGFLSGEGYWGSSENSAGHAAGGGTVKHEVEQAAGTATERTSHIGNFSGQPQHVHLAPSAEMTPETAGVKSEGEINQRGDASRRGHIEGIGRSATDSTDVKLKSGETKVTTMVGERASAAKKDFMDKSFLDKPTKDAPPVGSYENQRFYKD